MSIRKVLKAHRVGQGWPGEENQRNTRADYIRQLRGMRRQGTADGALGPYSPRVDSGRSGSKVQARKRFGRA